MRKLTGKCKQQQQKPVKVGTQPHKNMTSKPVIMRGGEYKCQIFEMHLKVRDQQLKTMLCCDEEWPPLAAAGESPHTETKTQHSHK